MKFKDIILQNLDKLDESELIEINSKITELLKYYDNNLTVDYKIKQLLKQQNGSIIEAVKFYRYVYPNSDLNNAKDYCKGVRDSMIMTGELEI